MDRPQTLVLYEGPSSLTGQPVVTLLSGIRDPSRNRATGPVLQTYFLKAEESPTQAYYRGDNRAVCGSCPHLIFKTCYVNWWQAAQALWDRWTRGEVDTYTGFHARFLKGRVHRWGAAGDPAAVPLELTQKFHRLAGPGNWLSYTHQWAEFPELRDYCMASVDSLAEFHRARELGWKTFRTLRDVDDPLEPDEFRCPKAPEAGSRLTCDLCRACGGGTRDQKVTPAVIMHGCLETTRRNFVKALEMV